MLTAGKGPAKSRPRQRLGRQKLRAVMGGENRKILGVHHAVVIEIALAETHA